MKIKVKCVLVASLSKIRHCRRRVMSSRASVSRLHDESTRLCLTGQHDNVYRTAPYWPLRKIFEVLGSKLLVSWGKSNKLTYRLLAKVGDGFIRVLIDHEPFIVEL